MMLNLAKFYSGTVKKLTVGLSSLIGRNEAEALGHVEPFHGACN